MLSLVDGLPLDSMTAALMQAEGEDDWREYFGRSADWYVMADVYDAINQNTRATGSWKRGKAPTFDPYPRPGRDGKGKKKNKKSKPRTLADLYGSMGGKPQQYVGGDIWQTQ